MLKAMRRHAKYFYVLFFIVILTFIFWGVGSIDQSNGVPVATVGKETITREQYWGAYNRALSLAQEIYKEKFDAEMEKKLRLKETVLNSLIVEIVIQAQAEKAGIKVSDRELEDAIINDPAFKKDGVFNREIYQRTLERMRITPQYYEAMKRRELAADKLLRLIDESIDLSPSELAGMSGNDALQKELTNLLLYEKRQAAQKSFIEGIKRQMDIKVNAELISG